jgi:hypothetical protein
MKQKRRKRIEKAPEDPAKLTYSDFTQGLKDFSSQFKIEDLKKIPKEKVNQPTIEKVNEMTEQFSKVNIKQSTSEKKSTPKKIQPKENSKETEENKLIILGSLEVAMKSAGYSLEESVKVLSSDNLPEKIYKHIEGDLKIERSIINDVIKIEKRILLDNFKQLVENKKKEAEKKRILEEEKRKEDERRKRVEEELKKLAKEERMRKEEEERKRKEEFEEKMKRENEIARKEQLKQQKLKEMTKCVAGYDFVKIQGGYRCMGGSHFVSDAQLSSIMN